MTGRRVQMGRRRPKPPARKPVKAEQAKPKNMNPYPVVEVAKQGNFSRPNAFEAQSRPFVGEWRPQHPNAYAENGMFNPGNSVNHWFAAQIPQMPVANAGGERYEWMSKIMGLKEAVDAIPFVQAWEELEKADQDARTEPTKQQEQREWNKDLKEKIDAMKEGPAGINKYMGQKTTVERQKKTLLELFPENWQAYRRTFHEEDEKKKQARQYGRVLNNGYGPAAGTYNPYLPSTGQYSVPSASLPSVDQRAFAPVLPGNVNSGGQMYGRGFPGLLPGQANGIHMDARGLPEIGGWTDQRNRPALPTPQGIEFGAPSFGNRM